MEDDGYKREYTIDKIVDNIDQWSSAQESKSISIETDFIYIVYILFVYYIQILYFPISENIFENKNNNTTKIFCFQSQSTRSGRVIISLVVQGTFTAAAAAAVFLYLFVII